MINRATYLDQTQPTAGLPYVLVNGVVIVRDGELVDGVYLGRAIRR